MVSKVIQCGQTGIERSAAVHAIFHETRQHCTAGFLYLKYFLDYTTTYESNRPADGHDHWMTSMVAYKKLYDETSPREAQLQLQ